jgi:hypothetical protein
MPIAARSFRNKPYPALSKLTRIARRLGVHPSALRRAFAQAGIEAVKLTGNSNSAIHYDTAAVARWCADRGISYDPTRDECPDSVAPGALDAPRGAAKLAPMVTENEDR